MDNKLMARAGLDSIVGGTFGFLGSSFYVAYMGWIGAASAIPGPTVTIVTLLGVVSGLVKAYISE